LDQLWSAGVEARRPAEIEALAGRPRGIEGVGWGRWARSERVAVGGGHHVDTGVVDALLVLLKAGEFARSPTFEHDLLHRRAARVGDVEDHLDRVVLPVIGADGRVDDNQKVAGPSTRRRQHNAVLVTDGHIGRER